MHPKAKTKTNVRYSPGASVMPLAVLLTITGSTPAAQFMGLGDLDSKGFDGLARLLSADGRVVVGPSVTGPGAGGEFFRWTAETGMEQLDLLHENSNFIEAFSVHAISADGSVIAGGGRTDAGVEGFRWTAETGMLGLGRPSGAQFNGVPNEMSADGEVIVGNFARSRGVFPFRWTADTGMEQLDGLDGGYANGVSGDGYVVVGLGLFGDDRFAFRWTAEAGAVPLLDAAFDCNCPPQVPIASIHNVSDDGAIIVGVRHVEPGVEEVFRWTMDTGSTGVGDFFLEGMSGDGSVIVGNNGTPVIWDAANGVRSLRDVFVNDYGLDVSGWNLGGNLHISADGRTIVGTGSNPSGNREAWIAYLAGQAPLQGDFNDNGELDIEDINLLTMESSSNANIVEFDLTGDGHVNTDDVSRWVKELKSTWIGDANLDGEFNSTDLVVVFQTGEYEDVTPMNSIWATGDWNGNGDFETGDLVAAFQDGGYEIGPRADAFAVPEPSSLILLAIGIWRFRSCRRTSDIYRGFHNTIE